MSDPTAIARVHDGDAPRETVVGEDVTEELTKLRAEIALAKRPSRNSKTIEALEGAEETLDETADVEVDQVYTIDLEAGVVTIEQTIEIPDVDELHGHLADATSYRD